MTVGRVVGIVPTFEGVVFDKPTKSVKKEPIAKNEGKATTQKKPTKKG